jgi:hypothetical protein
MYKSVENADSYQPIIETQNTTLLISQAKLVKVYLRLQRQCQ